MLGIVFLRFFFGVQNPLGISETGGFQVQSFGRLPLPTLLRWVTSRVVALPRLVPWRCLISLPTKIRFGSKAPPSVAAAEAKLSLTPLTVALLILEY